MLGLGNVFRSIERLTSVTVKNMTRVLKRSSSADAAQDRRAVVAEEQR